MQKYKVLLVDDEEEVIDTIERKINWEELGFEVAGRAQNGVKALEIAEKTQPDVVITDIKMPYMDGLELSRNLKKENTDIKIMILTGFDEFEYAKEAVHLEIEDYVLKPVNANELTKCMQRLRDALDKEWDEKLNVKKLEEYYMESLPLLQTNFFCSLIEGRANENDIDKFLEAYKITLEGPVYCCVVLHTSENQVPDTMSPLLLTMSVQREAREKLGEKWSCRDFTYLGNVVMIVEMKSEDSISQLTDDCDRFCKWADRFLGAVVTVGIGKVCDRLIDISSSYEGAREAITYRVLYGTKRSIYTGDISPKGQRSSAALDDIRMNELFKAIHIGAVEDIESAVGSIVSKMRDSVATVTEYNYAAMEIVGNLYRFCANNYLDFDEHIGDVKNPYETVPHMDDSALTAWITQVGVSVSDELKKARSSSLRQLIVEAKNMVSTDYSDPDMSLDNVCSRLGVSNSYFSSVFKKETGLSFITYLTDYRMEQALKLILETNEKSYEIAEHVGYADANYFSYVFKRKFGMSPSKYRSEHMGK